MEITLYVQVKHNVFWDRKRDPRPGPGDERLRQREWLGPDISILHK